MSDVFSLFAFFLSLVAVIMAGQILRYVTAQSARNRKFQAQLVRDMEEALSGIQTYHARQSRNGSRHDTFTDDDLAPTPSQKGPLANDDQSPYDGPGYPSAKSIELARELDRKRRAARKLAAEQGLEPVPETSKPVPHSKRA